ncbi:MAG: hypothetical protein ABL897_13470 [Hyphomicrobium sp.]
MEAPAPTFTNYSLLCRVTCEDAKLYYWDNFKDIVPLLDPVMAKFATTKVISWQHFNKIKWRSRDQSNVASAKTAPVGGSNNRWCAADLEKIFTLHLNDRTYHRYIWDRSTGPLVPPPVDPRGYPLHYMTAVLGNRAPLKPIASTDWYNRETDFRFQIPYYFGQFAGAPHNANMMVEFSFKDGWMAGADMDGLVRSVAKRVHATGVYKRIGIPTGALVHTFERTVTDRPEDAELWSRLL